MFETAFLNLGYLDALAYRDSAIHRLDPRAKLLAMLVFIVMVVSFPKYELTGLLPFLLFPVLALSASGIPALFMLKRVLLVSPFAVFIGIFNPLLDRGAAEILPGIEISAGWISFASILLKFCLTISSAILLVATTSFPGVCRALHRFGLPDMFVAQMLFVYRYLFVLADETMRVVRAHGLRSFGRGAPGLRVFSSIVGSLFLRTIERAERIYRAMLARGYSGEMHLVKPLRFRPADGLFLGVVLPLLVACRFIDIVGLAGRIAEGVF